MSVKWGEICKISIHIVYYMYTPISFPLTILIKIDTLWSTSVYINMHVYTNINSLPVAYIW